MRFLSILVLFSSLISATANTPPMPPPPQMHEWKFLDDLKTRVHQYPDWYESPSANQLDLRGGIKIIDEFGVDTYLQSAVDNLKNFLSEAKLSAEGKVPLRLIRGKTESTESYIYIVSPDEIRLVANDIEGMRRALYYLESKMLSQRGAFLPYEKLERKAWLKNRISRCFFGPIKRPPFNRDELTDDIDYYPDEYLNRLAREGINGLWLTVEFRQLAKTSFTSLDPLAQKRIEKLRKTVDKCLRYGIKTWIFTIEPIGLPADDILFKEHPEWKGPLGWGNKYAFCTSSDSAKQYIYESTRSIFQQIPKLAGIINISHGERYTTCLSSSSALSDEPVKCPHCSKIPKWKILYDSLEAMVKGMRESNPNAELISWIYQPQPSAERCDWVFELARHTPEGVILQYNFESGALEKQIGRWRSGGDYWLSYTKPSLAFARMATEARYAGTPISAKIQVGNSHEIATVPFVPVPNLLYRKYERMKKLGCSNVMQCWYFGNYPGIMNEAAGTLAFDNFEDSESEAMTRLARSIWGRNADKIVKIWESYSNGYSQYPLSIHMQYYGPMHAGISWNLYPEIEMKPLSPTWLPHFPPSGDTIGEALENHSLEEALRQTQIMCAEMAKADVIFDELKKSVAKENIQRQLDLGLLRALRLSFESAKNILEFYWNRREAFYQSRELKNNTQALIHLEKMRELIAAETANTSEMIELCKADSRLGFHSEAESHIYSVDRLKWRMNRLSEASAKLNKLIATAKDNTSLPFSKVEESAKSYKVNSGWVDDGHTRWKLDEIAFKGLELTIECNANGGNNIMVSLFDFAATSFPWTITFSKNGNLSDFNKLSKLEVIKNKDGSWTAKVFFPDLVWNRDNRKRPQWLYIRRNNYSNGNFTPYIWGNSKEIPRYRLYLNEVNGFCYGRLIY